MSFSDNYAARLLLLGLIIAVNAFFPQDNVTVIVLSNLQSADAAYIGMHLAQMVLGLN